MLSDEVKLAEHEKARLG